MFVDSVVLLPLSGRRLASAAATTTPSLVPAEDRCLRVRNTFLEISGSRSPSLERFYQDRQVRSCPSSPLPSVAPVKDSRGAFLQGGAPDDCSPCSTEVSSRPTSASCRSSSSRAEDPVHSALGFESLFGEPLGVSPDRLYDYVPRSASGSSSLGMAHIEHAYSVRPMLCLADALVGAAAAAPPRDHGGRPCSAGGLRDMFEPLDAVPSQDNLADTLCMHGCDVVSFSMHCAAAFGTHPPAYYQQELMPEQVIDASYLQDMLSGAAMDGLGWHVPRCDGPTTCGDVSHIEASILQGHQPHFGLDCCLAVPTPPLTPLGGCGPHLGLPMVGGQHLLFCNPPAPLLCDDSTPAAAVAVGTASVALPPPPPFAAPSEPPLFAPDDGAATSASPVALSGPLAPPPPGPAPGSPELPSVGSAGHSDGSCRPCAFFHTTGCENGVCCHFCHLCDAGEKKRRRKEKLECWRSLRRSKLAEETAGPDETGNPEVIAE